MFSQVSQYLFSMETQITISRSLSDFSAWCLLEGHKYLNTAATLNFRSLVLFCFRYFWCTSKDLETTLEVT